MIGDWFQIISATNDLGKRTTINKKWRFYRLSPNTKFLHYNDFPEKTFIRDGVEDLPERSKLKKKLNLYFLRRKDSFIKK